LLNSGYEGVRDKVAKDALRPSPLGWNQCQPARAVDNFVYEDPANDTFHLPYRRYAEMRTGGLFGASHLHSLTAASVGTLLEVERRGYLGNLRGGITPSSREDFYQENRKDRHRGCVTLP